MSDAAHANAMATRDKLEADVNATQQRLESLRRELKRVEEWLAAWDAFAGASPVESSPPSQEADKPVRRGRSPNPPKEEIAEHTRELAMARGAPVSRNAVRAYLENEKGIVLEGNDPDMVLSTMLWRMKERIKRLQGFGYWPTEMDYGPAGYRANTMPDDETMKRLHEKLFDHPTSQAALEEQIAKEDAELP